MKIFFLDDSRQNSPTRPKAGPLVALGGIAIDAVRLMDLTSKLDAICAAHGFVGDEPFKWSPGKELWMHKGLREEKREAFLIEVLRCAASCEVKGFFASVDESTSLADKKSASYEEDVYHLMIERIEGYLIECNVPGLIIVDRASGDLKGEEKFLGNLIDKTRAGSTYIVPKQIAIPILSCPSRLCRPLQLADVLTSSTLARVAGESKYSPPILVESKKLFYSKGGRIGGYGVKLHPSKKYVNLCHWIFGDTTIWDSGCEWAAPKPGIAFSKSESAY